MRADFTDTDWDSLASLGCTMASGALLWLLPQTGPWALVIAFIPWLARLWRKQSPPQLHRTALDIPIAIFLVTAVIGALVSYDRQAALSKLWVIIAAVLAYYAIAKQPTQNFPWVCALLSASAAGISIYFLLTFDAGILSTDLAIIDRLVAGWTAVRPPIYIASPHPNIAGGLIAFIAPYIIASFGETWQKKQRRLMIFTLVSGGVAALGLLISSSRAAWLALGAALGVWLLWWLAGRFAVDDHARRRLIFLTSAALLFGLSVLLILRYPGGPIALFERLPGADTTGSRLEIIRGALRLARDFPFTGGGLHAFPGLYSQYIIVIPTFFINYAHNLYLDLAVDQGVVGLTAYLLILAGGFWLLVREPRRERLYGAVLASLVVLVLHGIADDPLYAGRGTPFLLLAPAMAVAISKQPGELTRPIGSKYVHLGFGLATLLIVSGWFIAFRQPPLSGWYANIGSLQMAKVELAGFPADQWDDGSRVNEMSRAEANFYRALKLEPNNATAHYRLGLISMLKRDFPAAQIQLEQSLAADPQQPGVRKNLAFAYVWNGEYDQALHLMSRAGGARRELEIYIGWWRAQGRPDLSERAEEMLARLP